MLRQIYIFLIFLGFFSGVKVAFAAHPLQTDDTGTQGTGNWQWELNSDYTTIKDRDVTDKNKMLEVGSTLTYGATQTVDVFVSFPWMRWDKSDAMGGRNKYSGPGDIAIGAKWRAWEQEKASAGVKSELTFPVGDDERELGSGRSNLTITGLLNYETEQWIFLGNISAATNRAPTLPESHRTYVVGGSAAFLYKMAPVWKLVADIGVNQGTNHHAANPHYFLLGAIFSPKEMLDLDWGWRVTYEGSQRKNTVGAGITLRF